MIVSLKAADVIHTFWVPNLHGKKDMIPGRDATIEFRADKAGVYRGQCAEFCGYEHALMAFSRSPPIRPRNTRRGPRSSAQPAAAARDEIAHARPRRLHEPATARAATPCAAPMRKAPSAPTSRIWRAGEFIAAGTLSNNRGNLAGWIVDPRTLKPGTVMPATRLPPADLQALLVWLETLK